MTKSTGMRARRSDYGVVKVTERDLAVVGFIADQYLVPMDLFGELLGRHGSRGVVGERAVRRRASQLVMAGLLRRYYLLGRPWLAATTLGMAHAGREFN